MTLSDSPLGDIPLTTIDGTTTTLTDLGDKVYLVVNVASRCGLAPQYEKLEELQKTYASSFRSSAPKTPSRSTARPRGE